VCVALASLVVLCEIAHRKQELCERALKCLFSADVKYVNLKCIKKEGIIVKHAPTRTAFVLDVESRCWIRPTTNNLRLE
jgi:hypothetical protein